MKGLIEIGADQFLEGKFFEVTWLVSQRKALKSRIGGGLIKREKSLIAGNFARGAVRYLPGGFERAQGQVSEDGRRLAHGEIRVR